MQEWDGEWGDRSRIDYKVVSYKLDRVGGRDSMVHQAAIPHRADNGLFDNELPINLS